MEICKRENKHNYSCYIFDYDNKVVWKKGYDEEDNLYWQVVNYNQDRRSIIYINVSEKDSENYQLMDCLYNEIKNSKKDNEDSYYIDDIQEYNNFDLLNTKESYIHWVSDTGKINTEDLYILKNEGSYTVIFKTFNQNARNIKVIFGTTHSKYGNFSEAFRRDFGRTLDIAYDRYDECFSKMESKQYLKKVG